MRPPRVPIAFLVFCASVATACGKPQTDYRGAGLSEAPLPLDDVVSIYQTALAASFTLRDPNLSILLDPTLLPRSAGLAGGDSVPAELVAALRGRGLVKGMCRVQEQKSRIPLVCRAERAGYVARFSEPLALGIDTVQVYLVVQQYSLPGGPTAERFRFERAYHVVKTGSSWRAVREGRLPEP
ncbi:MAG: hypothetical protein WD801_01970 [Gemmatimonadaceae bacterium]